MEIYENIESERDRIQKCIERFGWTSDHNLDWFSVCTTNSEGKSAFAEFDNGGILFHIYKNNWQIWSDPLCDKNTAVDKITEFAKFGFKEGMDKIWCNYVSYSIYPLLEKKGELLLDKIDYSLDWPVLNMEKFDLALPGGDFKDIRNAQNKFNREHEIKVVNFENSYKDSLHEIINNWKNILKEEEKYIYDFWYHNAVKNSFKGFKTARILFVDGRPVGFNAGYEVINNSQRFAGIVGIHDYSLKDLGLILWLEDLTWIKNAGYKELDMQGSEGGGLKFKMQFRPVIERRTDTFCIKRGQK
ncbi:MAG: phosphatidylglycerol lysyltransferase domain-containing protein [Candidatus Paceibacterota bacterium]